MSTVVELAPGEAVGPRATGVDVIALECLPADRGVAALVGGRAVALFRIDDEVFAVDHVDPSSGAPVIARGIVGSVGERLVVTSPLHKLRFDLRSGECLDDPALSLDTWAVAVRRGRVLLGRRGVSRRTHSGNTNET